MPVDADQREERILDAAARLIAHYGYDKTTVSDIAKEAGVSKGAVYLHFKSKDDLFEVLILRESHKVMEEVVQRSENDPDGGTLYHLYSASLVALSANPLLRAVVTENKRLIGEATKRWRNTSYGEQWRAFSVEVVQKFQAAGLIRTDISPEAATYIMAIFRYGVLTLEDFMPALALPLDTLNAILPDVVRRALAPEDGGDREAGKRIITQMSEMTLKLIEEQRKQMQQKQ